MHFIAVRFAGKGLTGARRELRLSYQFMLLSSILSARHLNSEHASEHSVSASACPFCPCNISNCAVLSLIWLVLPCDRKKSECLLCVAFSGKMKVTDKMGWQMAKSLSGVGRRSSHPDRDCELWVWGGSSSTYLDFSSKCPLSSNSFVATSSCLIYMLTLMLQPVSGRQHWLLHLFLCIKLFFRQTSNHTQNVPLDQECPELHYVAISL